MGFASPLFWGGGGVRLIVGFGDCLFFFFFFQIWDQDENSGFEGQNWVLWLDILGTGRVQALRFVVILGRYCEVLATALEGRLALRLRFVTCFYVLRASKQKTWFNLPKGHPVEAL